MSATASSLNTGLRDSDPTRTGPIATQYEGNQTGSGVSWGAIFAGAAAAAALSLILLVLGSGLGFSSVSPWAGQGISATTFGVATIVWLSFMQLAASGLGGYIAGRLRTKWVGVHTDEVYFRDTAHGFVAWAVATLVTAAMFSSAIGSVVSAGAQAGAAVAGGAATAGAAAATGAAAGAAKNPEVSSAVSSKASEVSDYFVDSLFRRDPATVGSPANSAAPGAGNTVNDTAQVGRIFANALASGSLPADDSRYVAELVSQHTGLSQADAQTRVNNAFQKLQQKIQSTEKAAKEAAEKARKATAYGMLWLFVSLLIGAFCASLAATWGGRRRDL